MNGWRWEEGEAGMVTREVRERKGEKWVREGKGGRGRLRNGVLVW